MAQVVNPIYDTVFKYLMQDEKVAKVLIGNILKTKVVSIQMNNNEYSALLPDGKKIFKLDFSATILDRSGRHQLVHIEVQKALEEGEIMRFRSYLGAIYMDETKKYQETVKNPKTKIETVVEQPLPIHSIYILGHELGDIIQVPDNSDYINGLTHTVIFVIAPLIKKNVKTHLDRLLTIFSDTAPNSKFIELDEYYDNSEDYRPLCASSKRHLPTSNCAATSTWSNTLGFLDNYLFKRIVFQLLGRHKIASRQASAQNAVSRFAIANYSNVVIMAHFVGFDTAKHKFVDLTVDNQRNCLCHSHFLAKKRRFAVHT